MLLNWSNACIWSYPSGREKEKGKRVNETPYINVGAWKNNVEILLDANFLFFLSIHELWGLRLTQVVLSSPFPLNPLPFP